MNRKHIVLIGAFLAILSVAFALPQMDHSSQGIVAGSPLFISSITSYPVAIVEEFKPLPNQPVFPESDTKKSTLNVSSGLNGSSRSGLSESELILVLESSRRLNHNTKKWEKFTWGPEQKERLLTSWIKANNRVNSSRAMGSKIYYNKEVK